MNATHLTYAEALAAANKRNAPPQTDRSAAARKGHQTRRAPIHAKAMEIREGLGLSAQG